MVGRIARKSRKVMQKIMFFSHINRLGENISKKKAKITYLSHVFFPSFSLSTLRGLPTLNYPLL
jgi:hypothetical protein